VFLQTDGFPDKLKAGCKNLEQCEALEAEAHGRTARCKDNTIGSIRCDEARADLIAAKMLAQRARDELERQENARLRAASKLVNEARAAEAKERRQKRQADEEKATREREERQQSEAAARASKEREESEKRRLAAERREADVKRLALLGPSGRAQRMRECSRLMEQEKDGGESCQDITDKLIEAAPTESEKISLARLAEQLWTARARKAQREQLGL